MYTFVACVQCVCVCVCVVCVMNMEVMRCVCYRCSHCGCVLEEDEAEDAGVDTRELMSQ